MQRRAARYVLNDYNNESSVTNMLSSLNWTPLYQRRANIRLCLFYKIAYRLVAIPTDNIMIPLTRPSRHYNSMAYILFSHDYFKYSFFPRTVVTWNKLPDTTVKVSTIEAFKSLIA